MKISMKRARSLLSCALCWGALMTVGCGGEQENPNNETPGCTAGTPGCACAEDACSGGAVCVGGVCEAVSVSGLTFSSALARSCEVLVTQGSGAVLGATYADGVQGAWRSRAPRVAIAVSQTSDAPLPAGAIRLQLSGDSAGVTIDDVSCFDAQGARLDGVTASFE
jgi:hypothetical protein